MGVKSCCECLEQSSDPKKSQIDYSIVDVTSPGNRRVIAFKTYNSIEFTLEVAPTDTLAILKQRITEKSRINSDRLEIFFPEINNDHSKVNSELWKNLKHNAMDTEYR